MVNIIPIQSLKAENSDLAGVNEANTWMNVFKGETNMAGDKHIYRLMLSLLFSDDTIDLSKFTYNHTETGSYFDYDVDSNTVNWKKNLQGITAEKILESAQAYVDTVHLSDILSNLYKDENGNPIEVNENWTDEEKEYYWKNVGMISLSALSMYLNYGLLPSIASNVYNCSDVDNVSDQYGINGIIGGFSDQFAIVHNSAFSPISVHELKNGEECSWLKERANYLSNQLQSAIKNYQSDISKLEPNVRDEMKDSLGTFKKNIESAIESANISALLGYTPVSGETNLSMALDHILERAKKLKDAGENKNVSSMTNIITDITTIVSAVGRYIMYALILFFGVKTIWEGVEGKAKFKELLPFLLIGVVFFWSAPGIVDLIKNIFEINTTESEEYLSSIFATIIYVLRIVAFGGIIFTGVKLMFGAADKKAEVKSGLIPVLVGSILVFSSTIVISIVLSVSNDSGVETGKTVNDLIGDTSGNSGNSGNSESSDDSSYKETRDSRCWEDFSYYKEHQSSCIAMNGFVMNDPFARIISSGTVTTYKKCSDSQFYNENKESCDKYFSVITEDEYHQKKYNCSDTAYYVENQTICDEVKKFVENTGE